jgi:hydrogenase maturation protease
MIERLLALLALIGVVLGAVMHFLGFDGAAHASWAATDALLLVPLTWSVLRSLLRRDVGVDAIALVSMAGALALGEYLAGAVVALMLAGGNALEASANRRARRELTSLVERQPRTANKLVDGGIVEVPVDEVVAGDVVVVRGGEVVPVDGLVESDEAVVDEAALTGEPLPVTFHRGGQVRSGSANAGPPFELRAIRPAAESAYAALVRLVRQAEGERAPFVRLADRYAAVFLPVTTAIAAAAWIASGSSVRALAVFVVATPCPLILAAPIALISGLSRAARVGVVVKGGGTIEESDAVLVIDAAELGAEPGAVRVFEGEAMDAFVGSGGRKSVHEVGLHDLMAVAALAGRLPERRALIGIQPQELGWGDAPSARVAEGIGHACARAQEIIERWRA